MTHENVVVVGVDGSEASLAALDWAAAEARQLDWRLHIVCAYAVPAFTVASLDGGFAAVDDSAIQAGAQSVLDDAVARVGPGLEVTAALELGDPAGVLVELSRNCGLAVVGTRGGGGFADRLLGTVSSALPAHAHCPTVVVPLTTDHGPFTPVRRIVVGVDGSESATVALRRAVDEAIAWDAHLTAVATVPIGGGAGSLAWLPAAVDRDEVLADVKVGLGVACERAVDGRQVKLSQHALDGNAAALLAEFSTAVDLVVVGSRGRGGFAGLLLGSTSQAVLHHAVSPVLVVPARTAHEDEGPSPTDVPWRRR